MKPVLTQPKLSVGAQHYLTSAYAENTKAAYQLALARFVAGGYSLPASPELVVDFITTVQTQGGQQPKIATLSTWLAALGKAHALLGFDNPCQHPVVKETFKGMKRSLGSAQRQVKPLLKDELMKMVQVSHAGEVKGIRDAALMLVGFTGMFRRSELVSLHIEDLSERPEGFVVLVRRSKTDQEGQGRKVGIPHAHSMESVCPVRALTAWLSILEQQGISQGALFRNVDRKNGKGGVIGEGLTGRSVSRILKGYAQEIGIDPSDISGHSLRSGAATTLAQAGVDLWKVQQQGGWKDTRMLVERYIRTARVFEDNAMKGVW